jgi:hypothetical protein
VKNAIGLLLGNPVDEPVAEQMDAVFDPGHL